MKRLNTNHLTPGMLVGEDVFNYANQLIVPKGSTLSDKTITRLAFYSVPYVKILDGPDDDGTITLDESGDAKKEAAHATNMEAQPVSEDSSYSKKVQASAAFKKFKETFDHTIEDFKDSINDIVKNGAPLDSSSLLHQATTLIEDGNTTASFFDMLHNMRQYDDLTFAHSMNVALISNILSRWLHMSEEDIETATLCGLLHDIGKLSIPDQIIKKPSKLTDAEYKIVKTHTVAGYNILKEQDVDDHVKNAALMHHEKCDGSGYPLGLKGNQIDKFAKIVSIADVYDAMTAARVYRGPLCPFKVIEIFEKEALQKYEAEYILKFLENVANTYMNNRVRLSDGSVGDIVYMNSSHLSKPMIKLEDGRFVDLSTQHDLSIEEFV